MTRTHWTIVAVAVLALGVVGYFYWHRRKTTGQAAAASSAALGGNTGLGSNILQFATSSLTSSWINRPVGGPQ